MKAATAPMAAIEAQQLNMAYIAVAKYLGLPTQAYMALSDSKALDAQAGAESMSQALLAAIAGINSVSGPGMLDYVLVFSLAKLVLDNELCAQALHFVRQIMPVGQTKALDIARQVIAEQHLITAEHTLTYWPEHLHINDPVIDRANQDTWTRQGSLDLGQRAAAGVEKGLAAYEPLQTDPNITQELLTILVSGFDQPPALPEIPLMSSKPVPTLSSRRKRGERPK
jgi:trimethylamine--corrinoid protein Co-methyltransferase